MYEGKIRKKWISSFSQDTGRLSTEHSLPLCKCVLCYEIIQMSLFKTLVLLSTPVFTAVGRSNWITNLKIMNPTSWGRIESSLSQAVGSIRLRGLHRWHRSEEQEATLRWGGSTSLRMFSTRQWQTNRTSGSSAYREKSAKTREDKDVNTRHCSVSLSLPCFTSLSYSSHRLLFHLHSQHEF